MKKLTKRLMSAFLALVMVLGVGAIPAFAAENTDMVVAEESAVQPRFTTVYQGYNWRFSSRRDSNTGDVTGPGRFYATAGQTICFSVSGVHSNSSQGFDVYLYRANSAGTPLAAGRRGPYHFDANTSFSLSIKADVTGYYIISCQRTNDGSQQIFDNVTILVE